MPHLRHESMITTNFFLVKTGQKTAVVRCAVILNKERSRFSTGIRIDVKDWNQKEQRLKTSVSKPINGDINQQLSMIAGALSRSYLVLKEDGEDIRAKDVVEKYLGKYVRKQTFWEYTTEFVENLEHKINKSTGKRINQNTINKFNQVVSRLKQFEADSRSKTTWDSFDSNWLNRFINFLHTQGLSQNTIHKHYKALKQVLKQASAEGVNSNDKWQLRDFSVAQEKVQNFSLFESEMKVLEDLDLSGNQKLERVRDQFLLECWTGVRFSDLDKLSDIDLDSDTFKVTTQKTGTEVYIPITEPVKKIVRRYRKRGEGLPPVISNQRFNDYLKELGKLAGLNRKFRKSYTKGGERIDEVHEIWEVLTSHVGRRSFATNMFHRGIPLVNIMKITGHRTEEEFMKYINVDSEMSAKMIAKRLKDSS